jgi:hypothetical protein
MTMALFTSALAANAIGYCRVMGIDEAGTLGFRSWHHEKPRTLLGRTRKSTSHRTRHTS